MKKMTIALFTAAAMGTSGFAVAADVTGPTPIGRLDVDIVSPEDGDTTVSQKDAFIGLTGSATNLLGGIDASYYTRLATNGTGTKNLEYGYITFSGDFGSLTAGRNDDLAYRFAGVKTDVLRGGTSDEFNGSEFFVDSVLQYTNDFGGSPVTFGVSVDSDGTNEDIGDETQIGVDYDAGVANIAAVYSEQDTADTDELFVAATVDVGVATIIGNYLDDAADDTGYNVGFVAPLNDAVNLTVLHTDDAELDSADTVVQVLANLGGGVDVYAGTQMGDLDSVTYMGTRWGF